MQHTDHGSMPRRFWILAGLWTLLVVASSPLLIETLDERGWTRILPGLSVTATEVVLILAMVLLGIGLLGWLYRPGKQP